MTLLGDLPDKLEYFYKRLHGAPNDFGRFYYIGYGQEVICDVIGRDALEAQTRARFICACLNSRIGQEVNS